MLEPSFVVPGFPDVDDHQTSPLVARGSSSMLCTQRAMCCSERPMKTRGGCAAHSARMRGKRRRSLQGSLRRIGRRRRQRRMRRLRAYSKRTDDGHRRPIEGHGAGGGEGVQEKGGSWTRAPRKRELLRHRDCAPGPGPAAPPLREKWDALRNSGVAVEQLSFYDIPWPVLEDVWRVEEGAGTGVCLPATCN